MLRRERGHKYGSDGRATNSGQQDSQAGAAKNWVATFGSYLEEFTNLAGDCSRQKKLEPEATKPEKSAATEPEIPSSDMISLNPWNLSVKDLERLRFACKFMEGNPQDCGSNSSLNMAFKKFLKTALITDACACAPINTISLKTATQSQQETPKSGEVPRAVNEAMVLTTFTVKQEKPETSGLAQAIPELAKLVLSSENGTTVVASQKANNMYDMINATVKTESSSNASSCSGRGDQEWPGKTEGWTIVNQNNDEAKGKLYRLLEVL